MRTLAPLNSTDNPTTMWLRATTYAWQSADSSAAKILNECSPGDYPTEKTNCGKCCEPVLKYSDESEPGEPVAVYVDCYYQYYHATRPHLCSPCLDCCLSDGEHFTVFTIREDN